MAAPRLPDHQLRNAEFCTEIGDLYMLNWGHKQVTSLLEIIFLVITKMIIINLIR